jgi:hypothetical protein
MDQFEGIVSLFIACLELVLLINILIFAEKNDINKLIILLVFLLMGYQFYEFFICYFGFESSLLVYLAILDITLLPPLILLISLRLFQGKKIWHRVIFLPALFFIFYYPVVLSEFTVEKCTVLYATYNYPLGELYGIFYYLPIVISLVLLLFKIKNEVDTKQKQLNLIFLISLGITFIPAAILFFLTDIFVGIKESILCKIAVILSLGCTFFALKNKTQNIME